MERSRSRLHDLYKDRSDGRRICKGKGARTQCTSDDLHLALGRLLGFGMSRFYELTSTKSVVNASLTDMIHFQAFVDLSTPVTTKMTHQ